jgi:hypothetical protein
MTTIESAAKRSGHWESSSRSMRRRLLRSRSLPATAAGRSRRSGMTARLLRVGHRPRRRRHGGEPCAHRAVPRLDGRPRARGVDARPSTLDGLWLLPVRAHRRTHPLEPSPVRPPTPGPRHRRARPGSLRARRVPVHCGPVRPAPRRACCAAHRWVRSIGKRAGLGSVHPHMLRAAFVMAALDAGVPLRDVQIAARPRRPQNHDDPRPPPPELRPPRRLHRRRLRRRRLTLSHLRAALRRRGPERADER